jgi:hypothetical protein
MARGIGTDPLRLEFADAAAPSTNVVAAHCLTPTTLTDPVTSA